MVKFGHSALLLSMSLLACASDTKPLTQLVLVADTDISEIDRIEFAVVGAQPDAAEATRTADSGPSYVTIVRDQGTLGPVTVTARGYAGQTALIERVQIVSFVRDETLVVPLHLVARCRDVSCGNDETCSESGCVERELAASQLAPWSGQPPGLASTSDAGPAQDGGEDDAGARDAGPEDAAPQDAAPQDAGPQDADAQDAGSDAQTRDAGFPIFRQCGGRWVDVQTDPNNCGGCGDACNKNQECLAGTCVKK